ncbi:MAG: hypothetical protein VX519_12165 [Myxococcota bacterium]|nr:hypothetical protein [Myxococcota bacterium]
MMFQWLVFSAMASEPVVMVHGELMQSEPGEVRVEFLVEQGPGQHPLLAWEAILSQPGPFVLQVPMGLAKVHVRAAIDRKGDGIGPSDPQLLTPIVLELDRPVVEGLKLEITSSSPQPLP